MPHDDDIGAGDVACVARVIGSTSTLSKVDDDNHFTESETWSAVRRHRRIKFDNQVQQPGADDVKVDYIPVNINAGHQSKFYYATRGCNEIVTTCLLAVTEM